MAAKGQEAGHSESEVSALAEAGIRIANASIETEKYVNEMVVYVHNQRDRMATAYGRAWDDQPLPESCCKCDDIDLSDTDEVSTPRVPDVPVLGPVTPPPRPPPPQEVTNNAGSSDGNQEGQGQTPETPPETPPANQPEETITAPPRLTLPDVQTEPLETREPETTVPQTTEEETTEDFYNETHNTTTTEYPETTSTTPDTGVLPHWNGWVHRAKYFPKQPDEDDEDDEQDEDEDDYTSDLTPPPETPETPETRANLHKNRHISAKGEKHVDINVGIDVDNVTETTSAPSEDYVHPIIVSSLDIKPKHEAKHHAMLPNSEGVIIPSDSPRLMLVAQRLVTHRRIHGGTSVS